MFNLFRRNKKKLKAGDVVVIKKAYVNKFPNISLSSILTVEEVTNEQAIVVFMNDKGDKIFKETLPIDVVVKTG